LTPTSARPSADFRSSGDLVVDRRFLYARAAAAEGDHAAAAEMLEQALELAPSWAPLWLALAEAREKLGRTEAAAAYAEAAALDRSGALGAQLHLARIAAASAPKAAPESYVRALFDEYAERFEAHLTRTLAYRGPALLECALERVGAVHFETVIDLGCGTGLCGDEFRRISRYLAGVDLSPCMIEAARAKRIYDRLAVASNQDFLRAEPAGSASLVLAGDVLVYCGDLAPILAAVRRVLAPLGYFAFTLQHAPAGTYRVGPDLRYAHGEDYVRDIARESALDVILLEQLTTRVEAGTPVPGLLVVARAG
jgi:predicted TPR repeat methyltransferase